MPIDNIAANDNGKDNRRVFSGLKDYLATIFPSEAQAIRAVWEMDVDKLPLPIRGLPDERREAIIAGYAASIYLTIQKYPDQLAQGLLKLTDCIPSEPQNFISYAREHFVVGTNLPAWGYGSSKIERITTQQPNRNGKMEDKYRPLFVPIGVLETGYMDEYLDYYRTFRKMLDIAGRDKAA